MTDTAPAGRYAAEIDHSSLIWRIKHLGLAWYTCRFSRFAATLDFDPDAIEAMRLAASVPLGSVRAEYTGTDKDWDRELAEREDLLDAARHPTATYVSTAIERTGDATARVRGVLGFRGVERPLALDVAYNGAVLKDRSGRTLIGFSATGVLHRSEFGLVYLLGPLMPDEVQLIIETEMVLQP